MLMPGLVPGIRFSAPAMAVRRRPASLGGKALCAPGEYRSARQSGPDLLAAEINKKPAAGAAAAGFVCAAQPRARNAQLVNA